MTTSLRGRLLRALPVSALLVAVPCVAATSPTSAVAATPTASGSVAATNTTSTAPTATVPRARAHDLKITVRVVHDSSAGSHYVDLRMRNVSGHAVRLRGFSGVSFVGHGNGTQLGRPADWNSAFAVHTVVLRPGATTAERVGITNAGNYGVSPRHIVDTDGFRVYVPLSRAAVFVPYHDQAVVGPAEDQLQVWPVGPLRER